MNRLSYWEESLALYLDNNKDSVFVWGKKDCLLFAAGAIDAMTGSAIVSEHQEKYADATSAAEYLRYLGVGTVAGAATYLLGPSINAAYAQRGDIVMLRNSLGVCAGAYSWFIGEAGSYVGLIPESTLSCDKSWRV